ncbi:efflux RND transporter periplasmic adaptor subunit [Xylocopilactobacillus apicola]|uniref:RND transporter MFP subunit n=1 Tax=Xylocopilactobacillus apicola TaxID=2932184 RepID=A0AAU9DR09_9LACO|nr:biotin/lipoyl-binding protein [Xylocopilactobacillus apicola]BDR59637.1 RND transporter MFP subunit [Xylocopilactobacillus apicola]
MKKKKVLIISAIVVAVAVIAFVGINRMNRSKAMEAKMMEQSGYETYKVTNVPDLSMSGKIVAGKTQALMSPNGKLDQLNVKDGQEVTNGTVLLTVTDTSVQDNINNQKSVVAKANRMVTSANNALKSAQQSYNQADEESKPSLKDAVSKAQQDVNDANTDLNEENSKLTELQNKLHANLNAPFDGIVSVDNNSKDGVPAITMNSKQKVLQASVSEYDYPKVHVGDSIEITGVDGSPSQKTTITKINQVPSNQGKGTAYYSFSADVNDEFLYGQSVKLKIAQKGLKIPESAVHNGSIFKVVHGKARKIKADVSKSGDVFLVNSGVAKGEVIVANPDDKLKDGENVND